MNEGDARYWILDAGYWVRDKKCGHRMLKVRMRCSHADYWMPGSLNPAVSTRSLLKNYNHSSCGGADALTSLLLPYRSLRICSVVAPRHRIRRAHNLNCRSFSKDSQAPARRKVTASGAKSCVLVGRICLDRADRMWLKESEPQLVRESAVPEPEAKQRGNL